MASFPKHTDHAVPATAAPEPTEAQINAAQAQDAAEQAAVSARLRQNEAAGARVLEFDENATPQEKAAQAAKAADKLRPKTAASQQDGGHGLTSDIGGKKVDPTLSMKDVDKLNEQEKAAPGSLPVGQPTTNLPPGTVAGWVAAARAARGLKPDQAVSAEQESHLDLISTFIDEKFYGFFYYNGAVIMLAVLFTYFATRLGGGIGSLLVIGAFCSTYYNTSMRRTRQRARDDITREMAKKKMISEHESAEWINHFLSRFWLIYEPVLSATIIGIADQILVQNCPSFLDSIRMTTFTLGTKAPRIDSVRTFPNTDEDIVMMDWKFNFTPSDVLDLTVKQASQKINPKIVLTVRIGKGFVGAGLPILLEDINFTGHIRVRMKLMSNFPHVQLVDLSFMEQPKIDYVLKPIGGNTFGFDIGNIPGLSDFIQGQIHANLGPMMYNPNLFTINLEQMMSGTPLDTAVGVLQVNIWSARNLKGVKLGGGTPDPYVTLSIDNREVLAKTSAKKSTANPQFKETKFVLLNNLNGMLTMAIMDYNEHRPDSNLGQAAFDLKELMEDPEQENLSSPIILDAKERGEVQYSLSYYPVIKPEVDEDGQPKPLPETRSGVVRFSLHQAKELDKRSGFGGELCPKGRIRLNGQKVRDTHVIKRTTNPIFEMPTEFLVTDRKKAVITVEVLDDRDLRADPVVAYVSIRLEDLLAAKEKQQDWFPLKNSKAGRVRMSAEWKPVQMSGSMNGSSGYTPAIGAVKFWMKRATDVKNVEGMTGGKSDPYVQVRARGQAVDGTTIVNNNLNPEWNEILYAPVHTLREKITLEVMDYQNTSKDRSLGNVEIDVAQLAIEATGSDPRIKYAGTGKQSHKDKIHLGRGIYKGQLEFECEFLPAVNLKGAEFDERENEAIAKSGAIVEDAEEESDPASESPLESSATNGATQVNGVSEANAAINTVNGAPAAKSHTKNQESIDSIASVKTAIIGRPSTATEGVKEGITMSKEQLLQEQSGIIVFNILQGSLPQNKKNARLEVLFDDGYWPAYTTEKARTAHAAWDEVGESVVKELDWSKFLLKLRTGDGDEDVFAEFAGNTKDVLEKALNSQYEFRLSNSGGTQVASVVIECKYIPIDLHLEPIESVNNQGYLRVDLINARNLRAADRGNRSDPYFAFVLNGERMAKSKVVKKTLNPDFNENLGEFKVPSRVAAEAIFEAYDWDQVGTPDKLGQAQVDLSVLEPFEPFEKTYPVTGKGATDTSEVTLRFVFKPDFVTNRERKGTSISRTFTHGVAGVGRAGAGGVLAVGTGVGKAGLGVGKAGFGVGKGVVGIAGKGVGGVTKGVGSLIRPGGNKVLAAEIATGEQALIDPATGELVTPYMGDGLPAVSAGAGLPANMGIPVPAIPEEASRPSFDNDTRSMAESQGTPSKRKSRLHNPFKRHHDK
ncbi:related to TCB3 - protein localized to membranes, bud-enriched [Melanopsichium pennsylvanicum]|uniref:Related to TCB3 - protein localized to membranes, bud-enriched n=2 Tax=Melanopsichium pennsylvanicum TaxID=63383 RepID=A0AAJ4XTE8_9BASI|nr:related to TCB3-protein localized to membranes, bud-enriched [Melanopsichium pennsylvanicum 4]SNX87597.1 related to TCB3 - protein localized to membranes, bud-enriched [Melanopsichium pennsylvanicum]